MSFQRTTLKQSGINIVPVFESKQYVSYPQQAIVRQPQKHKFSRTQTNVFYKPVTVDNQVIQYELLQIRPGTVEGTIHPFKNVGEYLSQAMRTIQAQNRKLIEMVADLGKQVEKY